VCVCVCVSLYVFVYICVSQFQVLILYAFDWVAHTSRPVMSHAELKLIIAMQHNLLCHTVGRSTGQPQGQMGQMVVAVAVAATLWQRDSEWQ